jgi:hypothetical protein
MILQSHSWCQNLFRGRCLRCRNHSYVRAVCSWYVFAAPLWALFRPNVDSCFYDSWWVSYLASNRSSVHLCWKFKWESDDREGEILQCEYSCHAKYALLNLLIDSQPFTASALASISFLFPIRVDGPGMLNVQPLAFAFFIARSFFFFFFQWRREQLY